MHTTKEAAQLLGVTPSNLRIQISVGRLKATKMGRDWFIEEAELERYRREHQQNGRSTRWKESRSKKTPE